LLPGSESSSKSEEWTIGVEEEYLVIDPTTCALCADAERIIAHLPPSYRDMVHPELLRSQIEINTPICQTLNEVRAALQDIRHTLIHTAHQIQRRIAASGTHPFSPWEEQQPSRGERYQTMATRYQRLAREQAICGYHVHIGFPNREEAIQVMNRARIWLAALLALAANSPFWQATDSGYASFRTEVWWRWPMAGPPGYFPSSADYNALVQGLTTSGGIEDATHIYWDIRPSDRYPTLEFRVTDVCLTIDDAVMIASLVRALVQSCYQQAQEKQPFPIIPTEMLRSAHWYAARYGLEGELIDFHAGRRIPARELIERLLTLLRPTLESHGEWDEVSHLVHMTLQQGNGATRQRAIYAQTRSLQEVVNFVVQETEAGCKVP
jgi:carboxylate-amine ligase